MLDRLFQHEVSYVCRDPDGVFRVEDRPRGLVLPGSFNPLHHGHTTLAELAVGRLGSPVAFELSIANVDKPDLLHDEVVRRLEQFRGRYPVYVTRAPTFRMKAELFPGCNFVIGADTAVRIVDPRYYGNDPSEVVRALDAIRQAGCRFFVGGRVDREGRFVAANEIAIPEQYRDLFAGLHEREFRVDISSTELRQR